MNVDIPQKYIKQFKYCKRNKHSKFDTFGIIARAVIVRNNRSSLHASMHYDCTFRSMYSLPYNGVVNYKREVDNVTKKITSENFTKCLDYNEKNIIIDIFDFRFNELVIGNSIVTNSDVVIKDIDIEYDSVIYNFIDKTIEENMKYIRRFAFQNKQKKIHIVLFELAEMYDDYYVYTLSNQEHKIQKMLRKMNDLIIEKYKKNKNINLIVMPLCLCVAEKNCKNGEKPYHFIPEFYKYAYSQVVKNLKE